jgi:hypothetical protein
VAKPQQPTEFGVATQAPLMSALGQKQTWQRILLMSALPPKADIGTQPGDVRLCQKQTLACYSINSSARTINDDGMVRPSVLAVRMLMNSSNFVGCSTGKSDGLAPFKILST